MKKISLLFPFLLVFYEIGTYLSNDMYLPALPQMMNDLHLSSTEAQWTLTVWFLGAALMPLAMGALSDRIGRRSVLLWGGVIYLLGSITCAVASNAALLLIARFIQGCMVASMLVPGYAVIHEVYSHKDAIRILALMGSINVLAPALGPLFGSLILIISDWRMIFWVITLWSGVALLLLYKWMPESLALQEIPQVNQAIKAYKNILCNKLFMTRMFVLGFIFAGFIAWITAGPLLVIEIFHYSAFNFGLIQFFIFAAFILGTRSIKYLLDVKGAWYLINSGLLIVLIAILLMLVSAMLFPHSINLFLINMTLYSFGAAFCFAPLNRIIIESSTETMGARVALFSVFLMAFAALGSCATSFLFTGSILSLSLIIAAAGSIACIMRIRA